MASPVNPPSTEQELLARARDLAGKTLGELAWKHGRSVPKDLRRAKGWFGQLIEETLGATAASLAEPDFQQLGIELKTIPIGRDGKPRESTYVCVVPLTGGDALIWKDSWVRRKLQRVLWVPVQADPDVPLAERRAGSALLWDLEPDLEAVLRTDWEELMDMVCLGQLEQISARHGKYLQIRPKAANSRALRWAIGETGERILTNPRGFYLRTAFTGEVLRRHYALP
ncbi:MAG: DNA mismatch repair endonuclease MutH [Gammaproteobacteria bacterium]|nr:DNA mismatch repair endonuclease MutH [Gammaproteobacteria bacterium]